MSAKSPLSVVILAKNESSRIRECIQSVAWADEVLVVDDESTDDTVRVAESLGARVVRRKMDLEGRHRNWAHAQATHEWILSVDADERVTPELAVEITRLLQNGSTHDLYAIPRRNFIGTRWIRHGGWYPSAQTKLFKRSVFQWEETTVHPRAIAARPCGLLHHDLLHYSYRDLRDFVDKMNRQTTLEAQKWMADKRRVSCGKALWRAVDRFCRSYIGKRGYRDGCWGYIVAVLGGMYQLLAWAKYTEQRQTPRVEDIAEPFQGVIKDEDHYDRALLMSHLCAYRLAGRMARGKRVLEIGCGTGYGASYLGFCGREVVAVDMDPLALDRTRRAFFPKTNVQYLPMQGTDLAFRDGVFDVVGTFQVIEHIPELQLEVFVREIARVLAPDGVLVVSTLNLDHNRKNPRYQKPGFHEKEFTPGELRALLERTFPVVDMQGLYPSRCQRVFHRLKKWGLDRWGPLRWNPVQRFYAQRLNTDHFLLRPYCTNRAIDLIAICRKPGQAGA